MLMVTLTPALHSHTQLAVVPLSPEAFEGGITPDPEPTRDITLILLPTPQQEMAPACHSALLPSPSAVPHRHLLPGPKMIHLEYFLLQTLLTPIEVNGLTE